MLSSKILKKRYILFLAIIFAMNISAKSLLVDMVVKNNEFIAEKSDCVTINIFEKLSLDKKREVLQYEVDRIEKEILMVKAGNFSFLLSSNMGLLPSMISLVLPIIGLKSACSIIENAKSNEKDLLLGSSLGLVSLFAIPYVVEYAIVNAFVVIDEAFFLKERLKKNKLKELVYERDILADYLKNLDSKIN